MNDTSITESMILHTFDAVTASRGQQSFEQHQVGAIDNDEHVLSADVRDDKQVYTVLVRLKDGEPRGNCSCSAGFNCKHVAALLYAYLHESQQSPDDTAAEESSDESDTITPFSMWLGKLDHIPRGPSSNQQPSGQCILYLLQEHPRHGMIISFHLSRYLKQGGYGRTTPYQPANAMKQHCPAYMNHDDRRILRMAAENYEASLRRYFILRDEDDALMLKWAISTGRCHWQEADSHPLKLGETLPGHWHWQLNKEGQQRLTLHAEAADVMVIALSPPWYLDKDRGLCGRIEAANSDDPVDVLLHLPPLEPDATAQQRADLIAQLPTSVPQPKVIQHKLICAAVKAVVELKSIPTPEIYSNLLPEYVHIAELWLDYGDNHRHPYIITADTTVRMVEGHHISDYQRHPATERQALDTLVQQQLCNAVPWLSQAPLKPHQFTLLESRNWPQWLVENLPLLQQSELVEVVILPSFRHQLAEVDTWLLNTESEGWGGRAQLRVQLRDGEELELNDAIAHWLEENPEAVKAEALNTLAETPSVALKLPQGRVLSIPGSMLANVLRYMMDIFNHLGTETIATPQLVELRAALAKEHAPVKLNADPWLEKAQGLLHPELWPTVVPPAGLQARLRDYQQDSLSWLQMLCQLGMHGILADDMGLGKTVQALSHILTEKESGRLRHPTLVICPTSLVHNWYNEIQHFTPTLTALILHGSERAQHFNDIPGHDIVITTYPLLIRDHEVLQAQPWHLLILDEAQYIKNPTARSSRLVRTLRSQHRLCLTGTPMENHLGELWSLFDFLMPGYLSDKKSFRRMFRIPIENEGDIARQQQLEVRIRPFILRRRKEDVATELPPKTVILRTVDMDNAQRELYEGMRLAMQKRVRDSIAIAGAQKSHIILLDALMKMRQVCCDPRLLKHLHVDGRKAPPSAKLDALRDMLPEMLEEGRRILLFSQFTSMLALIEELVKELHIPYLKLTGSTRNRQAMVDTFQEGNTPLFLISLKAGGTGLNLTAADTVIHYDPWWNPAAEQQASDRAHRIRQDKPVFVYKLITEGTIEEKILAPQARKQALADHIHAAGESSLSALSQEEISALFEPLT